MRVFIAIEISNKEILKKVETFQKNVKINANPIRVEQIHFTLQFLGEITEEKCQQVKNVLNEISFSQFDVSLKNVGAFPNLKNPKVIWIGVEGDGAKKLTDLAKEIGMRLTIIDFKMDKKFKPHLTVFRVKKKIENVSSIITDFETEEFGTETISKIKLKKSVLSPKGPEYSDLLEVNAR